MSFHSSEIELIRGGRPILLVGKASQSDLNEKEKQSWAPSFTSLLSDCGWDMSTYHESFPHHDGLELLTVSPSKPVFSSLIWWDILSQIEGNITLGLAHPFSLLTVFLLLYETRFNKFQLLGWRRILRLASDSVLRWLLIVSDSTFPIPFTFVKSPNSQPALYNTKAIGHMWLQSTGSMTTVHIEMNFIHV